MTEPQDQSARLRFANELDRNFSVVASAGSGKTRAVTDRIVQLAKTRDALDTLPRLVVLTFANRAADEMQQRAREEMLRARLAPEVLGAFNRAWFGTIHAFCFKLLNEYGHYLGLPAPLELLADDEDLWSEFVQQQTLVGRSLAENERNKLLRLASLRHIMELGRSAGSALLHPDQPGECPKVNLDALRRALLVGRKTTPLANSKAQLETWDEGYHNRTGFVRWPICSSTSKDIEPLWAETFAPLRRWVNQTAICVAAEVQRDYRNFRLERGVVTYADQIALADELLQHPEAARRLRQLDPIVILDEAQDTDRAQFSVLLEITRPPEATGRWLQTRVDPPRPGRFCMVGDFQQSIWHDRADLAHYKRVHEALVSAEAGDAIRFSVTFRLDQRQIDFINDTFRHILDGGSGQVEFVELQPRPNVLPGQVIRIALSASLLEGIEKPKDRQIARIEAEQLAAWLKNCGPEKLRARNWRQVAILCPRKDWLNTMAVALRRAGLPIEVQSESDLRADSPAYAWLTALCTIMVEPQNHYEIVGVLREVYGLSDHDLAVFAEGIGARFQIEKPVAGAGIVGSVIAELASLRESIRELPLFAAVEQISERTSLRARLAALPADDFEDPLGDLETLLTHAAQAGAIGARLADFAERLRSEMEYPRTVRLSEEDAIQLITAHKAKGLEWDAVIVPFLGRRIAEPSPQLSVAHPRSRDRRSPRGTAQGRPRSRDQGSLQTPAPAGNGAPPLRCPHARPAHTRARARSRSLFAEDRSRRRLLAAEIPSRRPWRIERAGPRCSARCTRYLPGNTVELGASLAPQPSPLRSSCRRLSEKMMARGRLRAGEFIRKQNPSGYDDAVDLLHDSRSAIPPDLFRPLTIRRRSTAAGGTRSSSISPGRRSLRDWQAAFDAVQSSSPDPERSTREWGQLRTTLRDSPARAIPPPRRERSCTPSFRSCGAIDARSCLEGVIDLLAIDPRREALPAARLEDEPPQQRTGWRAPRAIIFHRLPPTGRRSAKSRGSTSKRGCSRPRWARWLIYTDDELRAEWERLGALRPDERSIAIAVADV